VIIECQSIEETQEFAHKLSHEIPTGSVVALLGNLGTGKTTFTQGFARGLGIMDRVGSPTFKLISEYDGTPHNLYHIDCYRLENANDFLNIGGEAFLLQTDGVTLIEWANIIEEILPLNSITIKFSRVDGHPNNRKIEIIKVFDES